MVDFLIGADPEFFLLDKETGKHVSAYDMIPGTKHDPFKVEGGAVQVDGMALEFNIDPAATYVEFTKNIGKVLKQLREMVPERYEFDFTPVAHFGQEYIDAQNDEAKALGCDPDFNAWLGGAINPKPDGSKGIRTASGHIHVGWTSDQDITDPDHLEACMMLTKQLDMYLGIPSLLWDLNNTRRSMYGAPGAFRPKRYGVEYRVLSNLWVVNPELQRYVYEMALQGAQQLLKKKNAARHYEGNYINHIFNQANWPVVSEPIFGDLLFNHDNNFSLIDGLAKKNRVSGDRAEHIALFDMYKEGWFRHSGTYEMISYDDLFSEEYNNVGGYHNPHLIYQSAKASGLGKPEFVENAKLVVKPAKIMYDELKLGDWAAAAAVMNAAPKPAKKLKPLFPGQVKLGF